MFPPFISSFHFQTNTNPFPSSHLMLSISFRPFLFRPILPSPIRVPSLFSLPRTTMSKPPSAFDALMSAARAAASKKKPPQPTSSSPKKRKSPPPQTPSPASSLNPSSLKTLDSSAPPAPETLENQEKLRESVKPEPANKIRSVTNSSQEKIAELKKLAPLLKKKPSEFNPSSVATWEKGDPVPFLFLSLAFDMISKETGRILITDIVCNLLRTVIYATPEDLIPVVYLSANRIAPAHVGLELGIGDASIIKALAEACGRTEAQIKKQYKEKGDLGIVAQASRSSQSMMRKPDALTIRKVFKTFHLIAKESGKDSQEKKKNHIKALLVAATDCEPQYLIRLLQAKLRIGYAEQTLLAALGQAAVYTEEHSKAPPQIQSPFEEASKIVKQAYSVLPDYDKIVSALLTHGVWELPNTCNFTPGVPVGPMLSKATKGVSEVLNKF
ncbi:PREDICTED: DNA ligase 1-like [Lupinus angustifolius]|uniref:DNA ligase 1-like n=1 Tax=Lupinus angustifolius TaxID=3871 RepID=UPI00092E26DC|nr:PREDICTED: DNA ligase 1-like [Lupinus angustifolius]